MMVARNVGRPRKCLAQLSEGRRDRPHPRLSGYIRESRHREPTVAVAYTALGCHRFIAAAAAYVVRDLFPRERVVGTWCADSVGGHAPTRMAALVRDFVATTWRASPASRTASQSPIRRVLMAPPTTAVRRALLSEALQLAHPSSEVGRPTSPTSCTRFRLGEHPPRRATATGVCHLYHQARDEDPENAGTRACSRGGDRLRRADGDRSLTRQAQPS